MELQVVVFGIIYLISMLILVFNTGEASIRALSIANTKTVSDEEQAYGS